MLSWDMTPGNIAQTPPPPYYAVIFTSLRTKGDRGYGGMAERMMELAAQQQGFLGVDSARGADGLGITVSYWSSEEAIAAWKAHAEHQMAEQAGQSVWYADYQVRVARVERAYNRTMADKESPLEIGMAQASAVEESCPS